MKPIHEASILKGACFKCRCETRFSTHLFYCGEADLGTFTEPCSEEDWKVCPFYKPPMPIRK